MKVIQGKLKAVAFVFAIAFSYSPFSSGAVSNLSLMDEFRIAAAEEIKSNSSIYSADLKQILNSVAIGDLNGKLQKDFEAILQDKIFVDNFLSQSSALKRLSHPISLIFKLPRKLNKLSFIYRKTWNQYSYENRLLSFSQFSALLSQLDEDLKISVLNSNLSEECIPSWITHTEAVTVLKAFATQQRIAFELLKPRIFTQMDFFPSSFETDSKRDLAPEVYDSLIQVQFDKISGKVPSSKN